MIQKTMKCWLLSAFLAYPFLGVDMVSAQTESTATEKQTEETTATFTLIDLNANVVNHPVRLVETSANLRYDAPTFVAHATVECSTPPNESFTLGFIQQVDFAQIRADYATSYLTWELPLTPVNDSDQEGLPWTSKSETYTIKGGTKKLEVEIATSDPLGGNFTWKPVLPPLEKRFGDKRELQRVTRDQQMTTWLAVMRESDGEITVLGKVLWRVKVDVSIDSNAPLGLRAKANPVPIYKPIVAMSNDEKRASASMTMPPSIVFTPRANAAHQLWWNPKQNQNGKRVRMR